MACDGRARSGAPTVLVLCLVQFVDVLGVTVMVTALPRMLADARAPASAAGLVSGGYAMFFGGLLMAGARLGDRFGHRRVIVASMAVFALGGVLGAAAGSVVLLTAARCLQGAAAAASVPAALRLLTTVTADGPQRRRAIAAWSAAGACAGASGFAVGGVVTELAGWRAGFLACLPLAAALAAAVSRLVPADRGPRPAQSLNAAAAAACTAAVMAVVVGTTVIARPGQRAVGAVLLLLAAPLAAAFAAIDRRAAAPLLPRAARRPAPRRGAAGAFLNTAATSSAMTLATLYLQDTLRQSPLRAAAMLMPFSVAVVAGSALAAPLLRQSRPESAIASGLAVIAVAIAVLSMVAAHGWALAACAASAGAGLGLSSVAATTLGTAVPGALRGTASGLINTAAQLGTAIGVAVITLIATATTGPPGPGTRPPVIAWAAAAAVAASGALVFGWWSRPASAAAGQQAGAGRRAPRPGRLARVPESPDSASEHRPELW